MNQQNLRSSLTPSRVIIGAGVSLGLLSVICRIAILWDDLGSGAVEWLGVVGTAMRQDLLFAVVLTLAALGVSALLRSKRAKQWAAWSYVGVSLLFLIWMVSNIASVDLLGEPVTVGWLSYSDILNSTYMFEALTDLLTPLSILAFIVAVSVFGFLTLSIAVAQHKFAGRTGRLLAVALVASIAGVVAIGAFVTPDIDRGKTSNPVVAFTGSLFDPVRIDLGVAPRSDTNQERGPAPMRPPISTAVPAERPKVDPEKISNVVFFVMESTAAKYTDGFGGTFGVTPNLQSLEPMSQRFLTTYAHAPASNFSLVSLMAGIVPELSRHSMTYAYPDLDLATLPKTLRDAGLRTGFFSSSDNSFQNTERFALQAGFETVKDQFDWECELGLYEVGSGVEDDEGTANDLCTIAPVTDWIEEDPDQPFFATIWTAMAHFPYYPGENPVRYVEDEAQNKYLNGIRVGDEALGKLVAFLERTDRLDSTLIVVVGDHGEAFGEHGNYIHARAIFEENLRVPLAFINPQITGSPQSDVIAGLSDIAPTVVDLIGIETPDSWQGQSLYSEGRPDGLLIFTPWNGFQVGYREGSKKFIFNADSKETWLFDLSTDPDEQNNRSFAYPEEVAASKTILADWIALQNTWTDQLLAGNFSLPEYQRTQPTVQEVVVYATGTRYKSAPIAEIRIDGERVGEIEVALAPSNAERAATDAEIDSKLTAFQIPLEASQCARRLEVHFQNDEWAGDDLPGDTNLMIQSLEYGDRRFWPDDFRTLGEGRGGRNRFYYQFWKNGAFSVELEVGPDCLSDELLPAAAPAKPTAATPVATQPNGPGKTVTSEPRASGKPTAVEQEIRYRVPDATKANLVWGVDGWNALPTEGQVEGTYLRDSLMVTPMQVKNGVFYASVRVPEDTPIDYSFEVTELSNGANVNIWQASDPGLTQIVADQSTAQTINADLPVIDRVSAHIFGVTGRWLAAIAIMTLIAAAAIYSIATISASWTVRGEKAIERARARIGRTAEVFGLSKATVLSIVVLPLLIALYFLIYLGVGLRTSPYGHYVLNPSTEYAFWTQVIQENGFVQLSTAAFLFVASILSVGLARRHRQLRGAPGAAPTLNLVFFLLLAFVFFFVAMEEISWGQWLFGFEPPDAMRSLNAQSELNFHNLHIFQNGIKELPLAIFGLAGLLSIPFVSHRYLKTLAVPPILSLWFATILFLSLLLYVAYWPSLLGGLFEASDLFNWVARQYAEVIEMMVGMTALLFVWLKKRALSQAQGQDVGAAVPVV